jgi:membrane associated rhomboid family serine protease
MIPIGDDNSEIRRVPIVTYSLIILNLAVFLYEMSLLFSRNGPLRLELFFRTYAMIPREITTGADLPPLLAPYPVYLTLLTSIFMHGGLMHFAGNMLYLWIFGDNVEDRLGSLRFLVFYLLCGLLATAAHIAVQPRAVVPTLGASGAIAGVLGAYLFLFPKKYVNVWLGWLFGIVPMPAVVVIGMWAVLQFISGVSELSARLNGGVAYWAHIGGFLAGLGLVWLFLPSSPTRHLPPTNVRWRY